jgi:multicomponent Na+:H+ antiporter subunit A
LLVGSPILESGYLSRDLPLLGDVKVTSALPFDVGVYLVVVGLVLMAFEAFGDDPLGPEPPADSPLAAMPLTDAVPDAVEGRVRR